MKTETRNKVIRGILIIVGIIFAVAILSIGILTYVLIRNIEICNRSVQVPSGYHLKRYILIPLSDKYSWPPVCINPDKGEGVDAIICSGEVTQYRVEDAVSHIGYYVTRTKNPKGDFTITDAVKITNMVWKITGKIIRGPVAIRCKIYQRDF